MTLWQLLAEAKIPENSGDYHPPALTGLLGSHPSSFETVHSLRDARSGVLRKSPKTPDKATI